MQQIQRKSLVDTVVDQLTHEITGGAWPIGTRIPSEADLSTTLGVSRPSVREGVRSLVQLGLLETRQGDGTYVIAEDPTEVALRRAISQADADEVIRVRRALDGLAAREAATARSEADLAELEQHLIDRKAALEHRDAEAFTRADVAFHLAVAKASKNRLLQGIYANFYAPLRASIADIDAAACGEDPDQNGEHDSLLSAIRIGDAERAAAAALGVLSQKEQSLHDAH